MSRDSSSLSRPPSTPYILSIPNEILHHILSSLPDLSRDEPFVQYNSDGKDYEVAQILVLRSVCRKFRAVTADLGFWYDAEFLFADLATREQVGSFMRPYDEQQFLKVLFSDADLVNSLGRRKIDWKFDSLEGLLAVRNDVPLFIENARTIYLEILENNEMRNLDSDPSSLDLAIDILSECDRITTLNIRLAENVDLDEIADALPSLEILKCSGIGHCSGSLQELDHLRELHVNSWQSDISTTPPLLPLNSAETLTKLTLECGIVGNPIFDTEPLDVFINLKSLEIGPLCDSICDFIIRAKIRLDVFETSLIRQLAPIDKFANMLRAECLRDLKEFGLTNYHDDNSTLPVTERYWSLVFDTFTSILLSVEEVQLGAPLHLQCCPYFTRMVNLKILNWDGTTNPYFGFGRDGRPKAQMKKALDTAFANFVEKPQFAVHLR
jgi:F-box domain